MTVEQAITKNFNHTDHTHGAPFDGFPEIGILPNAVNYHGSVKEWHGDAWTSAGEGVCLACRDNHRAGGREVPSDLTCLLVMTFPGDWRWLHRVRQESFTYGSCRG